MRYLVISTSLRPTSHSRTMCAELVETMLSDGHDVKYFDLRDDPLPFCDASSCYADPAVTRSRARIDEADGIVLATPIYNYTVGAAAKNLIELTGRSWTDKVVAFLCASGGPHSYMAIMGIASSLMLDFRSIIVPRFVYATGSAFADERVVDDDVRARIHGLGSDVARVTSALRRDAHPQ